jgi:hypothetical protein
MVVAVLVMMVMMMASRTGGRMIILSTAGLAGVTAAGTQGDGAFGEIAGEVKQLVGEGYGGVQVGEDSP